MRTTFEQYERVLLALCVWREARGEGYPGMLAVGCSIRNRVKRPSWWGNSFSEVLGKKWQYSSMAAPGDPQLLRWPSKLLDNGFGVALSVADAVFDDVQSPVPGSDSYYDISIKPPKWATPETFVAAIGKLRFHNLDNDVEMPLLESSMWPTG